MRVTIVLPRLTDSPSGGLKVQYENAAQLSDRGHNVTIVHPMSEFRMIGLRGCLAYGRLLGRHRRLGHGIITWFELDQRVQLRLQPFLAGPLLPPADITVLTAWQTAEATRRPAPWAGQQVQVVYDYEFWRNNSDEFRSRMAKALGRHDVAMFSPSTAVTNMLAEIGRTPVAFTPPGIATGQLRCVVPPDARNPVVAFALRADPSKGAETLLEAAALIRSQRQDVRLVAFGSTERWAVPPEIETVGVLSDAALRALYNECQVFLVGSRYEGFGLPALEAMACGAALVTTDSGGSADFAQDGINSCVVPRDDAAALAETALGLLSDPERRIRLSREGVRTAARFTLEDAGEALERAFTAVLA